MDNITEAAGLVFLVIGLALFSIAIGLVALGLVLIAIANRPEPINLDDIIEQRVADALEELDA